ncbi:MAG TPA: stage III sporulation protein AC [Symbiobacteriaceae bacterium]|nr:stage III sporulation protein AC [Symbiobacteriaceae bacterium]
MRVDVSLLFKIAGVGFVVMVMATMLKQAGKDEQGQMLTLVGVLLVLTMVVRLLGNFFTLVQSTFGMQ